MFGTLHIKLSETKIESFICVTIGKVFYLKNKEKQCLDFIKSKQIKVMRVIFQHCVKGDEKEFHCIDFNGDSFVMIDKSDHYLRSIDVVKWVEEKEFELAEKHYKGLIITVDKNGDFNLLDLTTEEKIFHDYLRTEVEQYFNL